eukprot:765082-Hanusia_phi.AAC.2
MVNVFLSDCEQYEYTIMADDDEKDFLEIIDQSYFDLPKTNVRSEQIASFRSNTTDLSQTAHPPLRFVRAERRADSTGSSSVMRQHRSGPSGTSLRRARNRQIGRELTVAKEAQVIPFHVLHLSK